MLNKIIKYLFGSSQLFMVICIMYLATLKIDPITYGTMCTTIGAWMYFHDKQKK